jgi:parallel beta-helix repeat protein
MQRTIRLGARVVIAIVVLVATPALSATRTAAAVPSLLPPPDPASVLVPCPVGGTRVDVVTTSHLDPACSYPGGLDIRASGVVLDCQGATVQSAPGAGGVGIGIVTPAGVSMSDVVVRNCRTSGFTNGIKPTRDGFRGLAAGHEFDHHLSDIVIEDSEVRGSNGVGIFVDGYVEDVTIQRVTVQNAGSTGIYLEAGSRDNVVRHNQIVDNGFSENGRDEGQLATFNGITVRYWGPGREGIAVDGSWSNVITDNAFEGNSAGGIFLYKNCGEFHLSRPARWYERRYGADDNLIEGNSFAGGPTGVWIGSRMGENTLPMECSDPAYRTGPLERIVLDRAARNTVRGNTFADVTYGVRVEDDGAVVEGNTFTAADPTHHAVIVGTRARTTDLAWPVRDTVVRDNVSQIVGNDDPFRWVYGHTGTVAAGNTALGHAAPLCRGMPPPHNPFIFVHHAVVENPNGPPTPKPDFVVPVLGALPPCTLVTVVPGSATVVEGTGGSGTSLVIPVTLTAASANTVTVEWATADPASIPQPAAAEGDDFSPSAGTVSFAPGQTTASVTVPIVGDATIEGDEYLVVSFRDPIDARIGGFWGLGIAAIVDDDGPVVVPGTVDVVEGDAGSSVALVPVTLDQPSPSPVTVAWSTIDPSALPAGAAGTDDFATASGTVTFAPGETSATVPITIVGDLDAEGDQLVVVSFRSPTGARIGGFWGLGGIWIRDDD